MKIHIDLPWGGKLEIEKSPMSEDAKLAIVFVAVVALLVLAFYFVVR